MFWPSFIEFGQPRFPRSDTLSQSGPLKSNLYVKVITLSGFETAFWVAFSTAVDISDDEGGMAMNIIFKPRVEATEQMAQNCMDISQSRPSDK